MMLKKTLPSRQPTTWRHHEPRSIKSDRVKPADLAHYDVRFFCDDCTHYDTANASCMMGYVARHTRERQAVIYERTGRMEFCRLLEID
jgi:hypothetical protein